MQGGGFPGIQGQGGMPPMGGPPQGGFPGFGFWWF